MFPVGFGITAAAPEIVPVLYGDKWLAMIPILAMLGIRTALRSSAGIAYTLFYSQDRVTTAFHYKVVEMILLVVSVLVALPWGLQTTALAITANSLFSLVMLWAGLNLIGMDARELARLLWCPLVASLIMWGAVAALRAALPVDGVNVALRLAISVGGGALVYVTTLVLLSRQYWLDFVEIAAKFRSRGRQ